MKVKAVIVKRVERKLKDCPWRKEWCARDDCTLYEVPACLTKAFEVAEPSSTPNAGRDT